MKRKISNKFHQGTLTIITFSGICVGMALKPLSTFYPCPSLLSIATDNRKQFQCLNNLYYHSMQIFLSFHWPKAHHVTCKINNCLQIMVCSCVIPSSFVQQQIIFCSVEMKPRFSPSCDHSCVKNGRSLCCPKIFIKNQLGARIIKQYY